MSSEYSGVSTVRDNMRELYLQGATLTDRLGFPVLPAVSAHPESCINVTHSAKSKTTGKRILHFYTDDARLEPIWRDADRYLNNFRDFPYMVMPDFSIAGDMPQAMKYWNRYRSMTLAWYYTQCGIPVVPSLSCVGSSDDRWLIEGLPHESTLAVSTKGRIKNPDERKAFLRGLYKQLKILEPTNLLMFGSVPKEWQEVCPTTYFYAEKKGEDADGYKGQEA